MKLIAKILFIFLVSATCFAEEAVVQEKNILDPGKDPYFNWTFGISPFDGIFGIEYQTGHHSFGIGAPSHFSYRYYLDPYGDSKFWGVYFGSYTIDDYNEIENGILFEKLETQYFGVGMGKRWQWPSGWNVTASVTLERYEDEYSNEGALRTLIKTGTFPFPGIAVGHKF